MRWRLLPLRAVWRWLTGHDDREESRPAGDTPVPDGDGRQPERALAEPSDQYIERLLTAAGGRMRQQAIIAAADWSPATVSRHLSTMESQGQLIRYTVGREKIVCLPTASLDAIDTADDPARS